MSKTEPNNNSIHDGIEHESGGGKGLIDPADTLLPSSGRSIGDEDGKNI
jgi:hypothetical protein